MKNYTITVNGVAYNVTVEEGSASGQPAVQQNSVPATQPAVSTAETTSAAGNVSVEAPMPGNILEIKVSVGQKVTAGQTLLILEAMKMENDIVAPHDGVIVSLNTHKGDTVEAGQVLITLN